MFKKQQFYQNKTPLHQLLKNQKPELTIRGLNNQTVVPLFSFQENPLRKVFDFAYRSKTSWLWPYVKWRYLWHLLRELQNKIPIWCSESDAPLLSELPSVIVHQEMRQPFAENDPASLKRAKKFPTKIFHDLGESPLSWLSGQTMQSYYFPS